MARRVDRAAAGGVVALTALAAVLRVVLARDNLWGDELFLFEIVHGNGLGEALTIVHDTESTPPLYFVLAWLAIQFGGDEHVLVRVPSLIAATATVPLVYVLGRRTVGRRPALIAAALFAVAPFNLFYGSEARGYSLVALLCVASALAVVELVRTGRRRWMVALALSAAAAAYTHYLVVFVLGAQLAWALWFHRARAGRVLAAFAGAALLYVPWIPSALVQFQDNTSERIPALIEGQEALETIGRVWFGHPFAEPGEIPGRSAVLLIAAGLLLAAGLALRRALRRRERPRPELGLVLALAAVTPVAALLYELGPNSIFLPRYLSASVPFGLLVVGALLAATRPPVAAAIATAAVLAGVAVGTVRALEPDGRRPDYRAAAQELDRVAPPGAPVLEPSIFEGPPARELGYYFERAHEYFADGRPLEPAFALGRRAGRLYVVVPEGGLGFVSLLDLEGRGFRLVERRAWPGTARLVLLTYGPRDA